MASRMRAGSGMALYLVSQSRSMRELPAVKPRNAVGSIVDAGTTRPPSPIMLVKTKRESMCRWGRSPRAMRTCRVTRDGHERQDGIGHAAPGGEPVSTTDKQLQEASWKAAGISSSPVSAIRLYL